MSAPRLRTARTLIRPFEADDAARLLDYRCANRAHLAPWEPTREEAYFTLESCRARIEEARGLARTDRGYPFAVLAPDESRLLGCFNFANVVRGAFQACHLGYGIDAREQGKGLMSEALGAGLAWAFGAMGLHRVMANYMPRNAHSARLLARLGFRREGYAPKYLKIAGVWEDHVLTAKLRDE
ncbi:MAG TPA: GNAT family N-acetyltransferase [Frateuria sp.]|uniref:GNAT family N-acetyltransferase n=1 Tax=Frateuria sp. TaxID=2211372 RepID=UPI002DE88B20|nr:GNAT family N-acetyltransferase [Frateuria sp.]